MSKRATASESALASLFPSMAMARLVVFFAIRPSQRFHLRDLKRRTRLSSASLQRELQRLVDLGAIHRGAGDAGDRRVYFTANEGHDAWRAWTLLLRSGAAPADVLREALVDAPGVEAAFVYGSAARGDPRPESDIDLFLIVDDGQPSKARRRQLSETEFLIGRPLDVVEYDARVAQERADAGNPFLRRVLSQPKTWVYGGPDALRVSEAA